jgi:hypothetical protein
MRLRNFRLALTYFALAYLVATAVGFLTYRLHELVMWVSMFTLMPVLFGFFFYAYLKKSRCLKGDLKSETNRLILFWIAASFLLDALIYVAVLPVILGRRSNWTFFIDQSPWIWLNYLTIVVLGHISRLVLKKRLERAGAV